MKNNKKIYFNQTIKISKNNFNNSQNIIYIILLLLKIKFIEY